MLIAPSVPFGPPFVRNAPKTVGAEKFVRLKALNISAETTNDIPSRFMGIVLRRLISVLIVFGPVKTSGPMFPRYPAGASAKQA